MQAQELQKLLEARRTTKVLSGVAHGVSAEQKEDRSTLEAIVGSALETPFHKVAAKQHQESSELKGIQPWRIYALDALACRSLREKLLQEGDDSKIPQMLATAMGLLQVTWLPNPSQRSLSEGELFEPSLDNMEHIAAASCAVQNMLLTATSCGIENFWSTGRWLRGDMVFGWMSIPREEVLLGSIFLFPKNTGDAQVVHSKLRERRSPVEQWSRWVTFPESF